MVLPCAPDDAALPVIDSVVLGRLRGRQRTVSRRHRGAASLASRRRRGRGQVGPGRPPPGPGICSFFRWRASPGWVTRCRELVIGYPGSQTSLS